MPKSIDVPEELWRRVKPLLPPDRARTGRPRADARACLAGIAYVLRTGCAWRKLPARELGVSYPSCWRRMRDWAAAGVWPALHRELVRELGAARKLDPSAVIADSGSQRAVFGGRTPARTPSTGRRPGASVTWSSTAAASRSSST
jgi:transposase